MSNTGSNYLLHVNEWQYSFRLVYSTVLRTLSTQLVFFRPVECLTHNLRRSWHVLLAGAGFGSSSWAIHVLLLRQFTNADERTAPALHGVRRRHRCQWRGLLTLDVSQQWHSVRGCIGLMVWAIRPPYCWYARGPGFNYRSTPITYFCCVISRLATLGIVGVHRGSAGPHVKQ